MTTRLARGIKERPGARSGQGSAACEATAGEPRRRDVGQTSPLMAAALHALPNSRYAVRRHARIPGYCWSPGSDLLTSDGRSLMT